MNNMIDLAKHIPTPEATLTVAYALGSAPPTIFRRRTVGPHWGNFGRNAVSR